MITPLGRVRWLKWLIVKLFFFLSFSWFWLLFHFLCNNWGIFLMNLTMRAEILGVLGPVREGFVLQFAQMVLALFSCNFLLSVIIISHVFYFTTETSSLTGFSNLNRIGQDVFGADDNGSLLIFKILLWSWTKRLIWEWCFRYPH